MICLYLVNVLISLTTVFEGYFKNFDMAPKEENVHYLSPMDMMAKAKMRVKMQHFDQLVMTLKNVGYTHLMRLR